MHEYDGLLHRLEFLRSQQVPENDPRIISLRIQLRDALELRKANRRTGGPLPKVTAMQTIKLDNQFEGISSDFKKYALVGTAVGITYVIYRLVTHS